MQDIKNDIGKRLQEIRQIYNKGYKASLEQFATELGETKFNIANYESGKANIPARLLMSLYTKGYNPTYIITGEGPLFAENEAGKLMRQEQGINENTRKARGLIESDVELLPDYKISDKTIEELQSQAARYIAAAGDIMKILQDKKDNNKK